MRTEAAVRFFRTDVTSFHDLTAGGIWQFSSDFDVQFQESLQGDVGWETLDTLVGYSVFGPTFRAFNLKQKKTMNLKLTIRDLFSIEICSECYFFFFHFSLHVVVKNTQHKFYFKLKQMFSILKVLV